MAALFESLHLYIANETLTFEPIFVDGTQTVQNLVIEREKGTLRVNVPRAPTLRQEEVVTVYGIVGLLKLNVGDYVIVVTDRSRVGRINGHDIYRLKKYDILRIPVSDGHLSEDQKVDDQRYLALVRSLLDSASLNFSYTFDLTHALQRQASLPANTPIWQRADSRFYWNRYLQYRLAELSTTDESQNLDRFILPIMAGFVSISTVSVNSNPMTFALISRRSVHRAGTRYNSRGIDVEGHVSNYVETEQIASLTSTMDTLSFVQLRGSIPVFWQQQVNVRYVPKLVIEKRAESTDATARHFKSVEHYYGKVYCVNLINKGGYEGQMGEAFKRAIEQIRDDKVSYTHFDFHRECSKMRYGRLSLLLSLLEPFINSSNYFHVTASGAVVSAQTGIVRSSCMDCLDRTNVVQSVLAREVLERGLKTLGVLSGNMKLSDEADFDRVFRNVWADNADAVSSMYSGTGALKTDFTRTGKRTKMGALQDGVNSVVRYWKNNFMDGARQDAFELVLGNYRVYPARKSPFLARNSFADLFVEGQNNVKLIVLPLILLAALLSLVTNLILPPPTLLQQLQSIFFSIAVILVVLQVIIHFGTEFVSRPRLTEMVVAKQAPTPLVGGGLGMTEMMSRAKEYDRTGKEA